MIVFGLPMYGGQCTAEFADGMSRLQSSLDMSDVPYRVLQHSNDSLVTRARNCLVARFMRDPALKSFNTFMFIDADIVFEPEHVMNLWNLNVEVATACYPLKQDDAGTVAWKNGKRVAMDKLDGPTQVDLAGTGFLMIKRSAFEKLQNAHPETRHMQDNVGEVYALFDLAVSDEPEWQDRIYLSEDYLFCKRWRAIGGEIILDPSIKLGHVGRKVYW